MPDAILEQSRAPGSCRNHPQQAEYRVCSRCNQPFCEDCIAERRSSFVVLKGERSQPNSTYLCDACWKAVSQRGFFWMGLLFGLVIAGVVAVSIFIA